MTHQTSKNISKPSTPGLIGRLMDADFFRWSGILFRKDFSFYNAELCSFSRRSNCAFAATMMVERLIATAPTLIGRSSPHRTRRPPRDRDGNQVIGSRPNEILNHLSIGSPR